MYTCGRNVDSISDSCVVFGKSIDWHFTCNGQTRVHTKESARVIMGDQDRRQDKLGAHVECDREKVLCLLGLQRRVVASSRVAIENESHTLV